MSPVAQKGLDSLEAKLDPIVARYRGKKGVSIPLLADIQKTVGYIAEEAVEYVSGKLDLPAADKQRLLDMTPGSYTGLAERLAREA